MSEPIVTTPVAARRKGRTLPPGWRRVWVPTRGWRVVGPEHRQKVDDFFRVPMMVLAVLVLPLLALEYWATETLVQRPVLAQAAWVGLSLIWAAFLIEFVVKISIAESRWAYVYYNWLDIVVLVLPFLRLLRAVKALKAVAVLRLAQGFTLRGVFIKLMRSMAGFVFGAEVVRRLFRIRPQPAAIEEKERARLERLSRRQLIEQVLALQARQRVMEETMLALDAQAAPGASAARSPQPSPTPASASPPHEAARGVPPPA